MNIINVAQGIFVILGAYLSYAALRHVEAFDLFVGWPSRSPPFLWWVRVVERLFSRVSKDRRRKWCMSILVTYAVSLVIEGVLTWCSRPIRSNCTRGTWTFGEGLWHLSAVYLPSGIRDGGVLLTRCT